MNINNDALLTALWAHMGLAIFVVEGMNEANEANELNEAPQTQLRHIGTAPPWLTELFPTVLDTEVCQWQDLGVFLENFAFDAEARWQDGQATVPLYSGYWTTQNEAGKSYNLEAIATLMAGQAILLLDNDPRHYDQTQDILQRGRRMMLSYEKLERQPYFDAVTGLYTIYGLSNLANERWLNHPDHQKMMVMNITIENTDFLNERSMNESALIETARLVRHVFSPSDLAARIDTHHFKILLSDTERAYPAAEEIRNYVNERQQDNTLYPLELAIELLELSSESQLQELLAG